MEKAKQAVANFVSHDGKHKTSVDEDIRKAVTDEHVRPHAHEEVTTAVDKDIHQDHHHTTIQPIKAKEVLPEQHTHNIIPVEHKKVEHGNDQDLRAALDRDANKYRDTSVTHGTTHSTSAAPVVESERIHHHVHEHVQPVVQKETVAPQVVHTTVPIHETHHADAVHHGTSTLPAKTLEEFKNEGGTLHGKNTARLSDVEGCPASYNKNLQNEQFDGDKGMHSHTQGVVAGQPGTLDHRTSRHTSGHSQSEHYDLTSGGDALRGNKSTKTMEPRTDPNFGARDTGNSAESASSPHAKGSLVDKLMARKN